MRILQSLRLNYSSREIELFTARARKATIYLHHDQGGVPEYYSTQAYLSIPTVDLLVDSVRFYLNTYSGVVIKTLPVK